MVHVRGRRIGLILQDPKYSLNPVMRVGEQIAETYLQHYPAAGGRAAAWARVLEMLNAVEDSRPGARRPSSIRTRSPAAWASAS